MFFGRIKKNKFKLLLVCLAGFVVLFFAQNALAQVSSTDTGLQFGTATGLTTTDIRIIIANIIRIALGLIGIVALIIVIYAGVQWMLAGGDNEKVNKAKKTLINGVIGLIIILMAFAITQFIFNMLVSATGGDTSIGGDGGGGGNLPPGGSSIFEVKSYSLIGNCNTPQNGCSMLGKQDVTFSKKINLDTLGQGLQMLKILPDNSTEVVTGEFKIIDSDNKVVRFSITDQAPCFYLDGSPIIDPTTNAQAVNCFKPNTEYQVKVIEGTIKDADSNNITCTKKPCTQNFTTDNFVDFNKPSIQIVEPPNGKAVNFADSIVDIVGDAKDDVGIGHVEYFVDNNSFDGSFISPNTGSIVSRFYLDNGNSVTWDFSVLGIDPENDPGHTIKAKTYDLDNNLGESSETKFKIWPEYCFEGDDVICGAEHCPACENTPCTEDIDCESGFCNPATLVCETKPVITGVYPDNGAIGNFVTIYGQNFGNTQAQYNGKIYFYDIRKQDSILLANLAANCVASWSDTQIIVEVPDSDTGPIKFTNNLGSDTTSFDNPDGWQGDFSINDTVRPGLCGIEPTVGEFNTETKITGKSFGTSRNDSHVYFGNSQATIAGIWSDTVVDKILVPNVEPRKMDVSIKVGEEYSNPVSFTVNPSKKLPIINNIDPDSGPKNQYITLSGENFSTSGTVYFVSPQTSDKYPAEVDFPAECDGGFWHDTYVLVKVPNIAEGLYNIQINNQYGDSNFLPFTISNNLPLTPGICKMDPDNGPVGITVTLFGEGFGDVKGSVEFWENQKVDQGAISWDATQIDVYVPPLAKNGPVRVIANNIGSNRVDFTVTDCSQVGCSQFADKSYCCGQSCVASAQVCEQAVAENDSTYRWQFSTGVIPRLPQVFESQSCIAFQQSPSPWKNDTNVCVNVDPSVTFNMLMDKNSLIDQNNFYLEKFDNDTQKYILQEEYRSHLNNETTIENGVRATRASLFSRSRVLDANSKYRVTVKGNVKSLDGNTLGRDYTWQFTTNPTGETCKIDQVFVDPQLLTVNETETNLDYLASALTKECYPINACATGNDWQWGINDNKFAKILNNQCLEVNAEATVDPLAETGPNKPVKIEAVVSTIAGTGGLDKVSDTGDLFIIFSDPFVKNYWPDCDSACINASLGAEFNVPMKGRQGSSLVAITDSFYQKVFLKQCLNESCKAYVGTDQNMTTALDSTGKIADFAYSGNLKANTYYRVVINEAVQSTQGKTLINLNFDNNNDTKNDSFSWTFKTKNDTGVCDISNIDVTPEKYDTDKVGELIKYMAQPFGVPDECNPNGQRLKASSYDWQWSSSFENIATITNTRKTDSLPSYCTSNCLNAGSRPQASVCGNGNIEIGEDCDDSNLNNNDGCSDICLNEGTTDACGNGRIDIGEDCDDGNNKSDDGCSESCLHEGSYAGDSVCGNGDIGDGEDCDDGNTSNGDGCSNVCLNEGSESFASVCGNSNIEKGEDCDDGNTNNGDGCSSICLAEGSILFSDCGNGGIDGNTQFGGENCDDNNIVSGDGCSSKCLKEGSNYNFVPPSYCGNGMPYETGETCEVDLNCSAPGACFGSFEQVATVWGEVTDSLNETTQITASAAGKEGKADLTFAFCENNPPSITEIYPADGADGVCLNSAMSVTFNQQMNHASLENSVVLAFGASPDGIFYELAENCPTGLVSVPINLSIGLTRQRNASGGFTIIPVPAGSKLCTLPVNLNIQDITNENDIKVTKVDLGLNAALAPTQDYTIFINSAASNICNIPMESNIASGFYTAKKVCMVDYVVSEPSEYIFEQPSDLKDFTVTVYTSEKQEIQNISGYKYDYQWQFITGGEDLLNKLNNVGQDCQSNEECASNICTGLTCRSGDNSNTVSVDQKLKNGSTQLAGQIIVTEDNYFNTVGQIKESYSDITVDLCSNPWTIDESKQFNDYIYNYFTTYCRDRGVSGATDEGKADDLPLLSAIEKNYDSNNFANNGIDGEIMREIFFVRKPDYSNPTTNDSSTDAIAIRVNENLAHKSAMQWYKDNVPNPGSPGEIDVDGFDAVQDGRTLYINAPSCSKAPNAQFMTCYTNIFVLSYSENSNSNTLEIYKQFVDNFDFIHNLNEISYISADSSNEQTVCPTIHNKAWGIPADQLTEKDCIRRDLQRINDMVYMNNLLANYYSAYGVYPVLDAGTYKKGQSVSVWPSWQAVLGNQLSVGLPIDPINRLFSRVPDDLGDECPTCTICGENEQGLGLQCETMTDESGAVFNPQCVDNQYCVACPVGYDKLTCWQPETFETKCIEGSFVYSYKYSEENSDPNAIAQTITGSIEVGSILEHKKIEWKGADPPDDSIFGNAKTNACESSFLNTITGEVSQTVICEPDQCAYGTECKIAGSLRPDDQKQKCVYNELANTALWTSTCGDGVVDPGEECDGTKYSDPNYNPTCTILVDNIQRQGQFLCSANCNIEKICTYTCGNGLIKGVCSNPLYVDPVSCEAYEGIGAWTGETCEKDTLDYCNATYGVHDWYFADVLGGKDDGADGSDTEHLFGSRRCGYYTCNWIDPEYPEHPDVDLDYSAYPDQGTQDFFANIGCGGFCGDGIIQPWEMCDLNGNPVPEKVEVVFIFDTSASMGPKIISLCDSVDQFTEEYGDKFVYEILGVYDGTNALIARDKKNNMSEASHNGNFDSAVDKNGQPCETCFFGTENPPQIHNNCLFNPELDATSNGLTENPGDYYNNSVINLYGKNEITSSLKNLELEFLNFGAQEKLTDPKDHTEDYGTGVNGSMLYDYGYWPLTESWGEAIIDVVNNKNWTPGYGKVVIIFSDEGAYLGSGWDVAQTETCDADPDFINCKTQVETTGQDSIILRDAVNIAVDQNVYLFINYYNQGTINTYIQPIIDDILDSKPQGVGRISASSATGTFQSVKDALTKIFCDHNKDGVMDCEIDSDLLQ